MRRVLAYCRSAFVALVLMVSLTLGACASTAPVVGIPTPVLCRVELPAAPDFAFDSLPVGSDIFTQAKTLLADRRQRIDYERQLRAAGEACS